MTSISAETPEKASIN